MFKCNWNEFFQMLTDMSPVNKRQSVICNGYGISFRLFFLIPHYYNCPDLWFLYNYHETIVFAFIDYRTFQGSPWRLTWAYSRWTLWNSIVCIWSTISPKKGFFFHVKKSFVTVAWDRWYLLECSAFIVLCSSVQNDTVTVRTRKFMTNRLLQRKQMASLDNMQSALTHSNQAYLLLLYSLANLSSRSLMFCIPARPQSQRLKSGRSSPRCTRRPPTSCSSLASRRSLAVARQRASPWSTTP